MAVTSPKSLPPVKATRVPSGRCAVGLAVLTGAQVVAGVDGGRGEFAGLAAVRSVARAPGIAGLGAVSLGGEVAHGLEGIAAVAEVLDPVGQEFQFARLDLGAVLFLAEVFHFGRDLVDAAVEALDLGVQRIHEAPEQALAFVGELRAVRCDDTGQDVDRFLDPGQSVSSSFQISRLSNSSGPGVAPNRAACSQAIAVCDDVSVLMTFLHDSLHCNLSILRGVLPRRDDSLFHALATEPRLPECLRRGDARVVRAQGAERAEPRSRIPPVLAAQRRGIASYRRNGA